MLSLSKLLIQLFSSDLELKSDLLTSITMSMMNTNLKDLYLGFDLHS